MNRRVQGQAAARSLLRLGLSVFSVFICSVALFAQVDDTTPPEIQSFDFAPKAVDVSAGPQNVIVTMRITDNLSGFTWGFLRVSSPSTAQLVTFCPWGGDRIEGDATDGLYRFEITIPQYSEVGEWHMANFDVHDGVNNGCTHDIAALGFTHILTVSQNQNPVSDAGPDRSVIVAEDVLFDGSASSDPDGYIVSWVWDFGDGSAAATGMVTSHRFSRAGQYMVVLTVTDDEGETGIDQAEVTVNELITAVEDLIADITDCLPVGVADSLIAKLNGVIESFDSHNDIAAINMLNAFIWEVSAQKGKKIPEETADQWIEYARRIIQSVQAGANSLAVLKIEAKAKELRGYPGDSTREAYAESRFVAVRVQVDGPAELTMTIADRNGKIVGIVPGRRAQPGDHIFPWNGRDIRGNPCPEGEYHYTIWNGGKLITGGRITLRCFEKD
ncbi:MAG: PKD domain-containing protein [Candidatus Aminicenantes bacterium]|nr:PKD domain-containing protein [Candidatus Aminicenantes bacterium]